MHNHPVASPPKTLAPEIAPRVIRIQAFTLVWMIAEAAVSLGAAWAARSPALFGFGGDSVVELLSAVVVLRRFYRPAHEAHSEKRAAKIAGACSSLWRGLSPLQRCLRCSDTPNLDEAPWGSPC